MPGPSCVVELPNMERIKVTIALAIAAYIKTYPAIGSAGLLNYVVLVVWLRPVQLSMHIL